MLVPSTFTGWYRKIIMTSAKPSATAKSRVPLRNSRRNWGNELFLLGKIVSGGGVSDFLCSNIYNTPTANPPIALKSDHDHLSIQSRPPIKQLSSRSAARDLLLTLRRLVVASSKSPQRTRQHHRPLASRPQRKTHASQARYHRRLRPQYQMSQRRPRKSRRARSRNLAIRPAALRPNRQRHSIRRLPPQHVSQRLRLTPLRKQNLALRLTASRKRFLRRNHRAEFWRAHPPRLLRRLHQNLLPPLSPFLRRRHQSLVTARRRHRHDIRHAQFRSLLQAPLKPIEFH